MFKVGRPSPQRKEPQLNDLQDAEAAKSQRETLVHDVQMQLSFSQNRVTDLEKEVRTLRAEASKPTHQGQDQHAETSKAVNRPSVGGTKSAMLPHDESVRGPRERTSHLNDSRRFRQGSLQCMTTFSTLSLRRKTRRTPADFGLFYSGRRA